jgi:hypothetical protein
MRFQQQQEAEERLKYKKAEFSAKTIRALLLSKK